jgi:hypothetical protein
MSSGASSLSWGRATTGLSLQLNLSLGRGFDDQAIEVHQGRARPRLPDPCAGCVQWQSGNHGAHDLQGAWACSACHDAVDARSKTEFTREQLSHMHMQGMVRTIDILVSEGKVAA